MKKDRQEVHAELSGETWVGVFRCYIVKSFSLTWSSCQPWRQDIKEKFCGDFLGGTVDKNLSAFAGTRVRYLVWEDSMCLGATKPTHHNYWACALEPEAQVLNPACPRACVPQEKPPQWEACALQLESSPCSLQLGKRHAAIETQHSQKIINFKRIFLKKLTRVKNFKTPFVWRFYSVHTCMW